MLSSKAKYAVRAAIHMADRMRMSEWIQTAQMAEQERIPRKFLEAILVQLRDHGIVESRRGSQGGHRLLKDPAAISMADIIRIVDGPLALTPCASVTRYRQCLDCVDVRQCRLQALMRRARDAVAGVLESSSLAELAEGGGTAEPALEGRRPPVTPRKKAPASGAPSRSRTPRRAAG